VVFVVDDLLAWLVGLVADAGRKKLITRVLGTDQARALRPAVEAAVEAAAAQLAPSAEQFEQLVMVIGEVFRGPPRVALAGQATLLEALQAGIAARLTVLDDPDITATGQSSMELLGVPGGVLAETLAGHLMREVMVRGSEGGPLAPLADQLNHDMTHLQGQRLEGMVAQVVSLVTNLAREDRGPELPRKPVRLAPRPALLAGREELLADLDTMLTGGGDRGPGIVALCGLGGTGKTSVAVEYAHRHLGEVGLVWQFPAEDSTVLAAGFAGLAAQLGAQGIAGTQDLVASVHAVLAAFPEDWLLVFDNVPARVALERFLPPAGPGRVLVTSRNFHWPPGQGLDVPVLDLEVAAGFLVTRAGDVNEQAARELAGELGGLPLALEQAGAYVEASGGSLAGYLGLFRRRRPEMLARGTPIGYDSTVAATWSLAFVDVEQSAPTAASLLRLLAFCAPEPVPLQLLLQPRPGLTDGFAGDVARALVPLLGDELAAGDAIAVLRRYSLVTLAGNGLVSVHRLVQAVTLDQVPADLVTAWQRAAAAVIEAALPGDPTQRETWPAYALLLPHALAALPPDSDGMERVSTYLGHSGSYGAARDREREVLQARARILGPEHPDTLTARDNLAFWTGQAGDPAGARDQLAALLPIRERVSGPQHPDTLIVRAGLARWTGEAGDVAGARDQSAALVTVVEQVSGPEHPLTQDARLNLARWTGLAGDPAGARDQFAALLPIRERVFGAEHIYTLSTGSYLAYWTGEAGDAAGARDQFAALVPIRERILGPKHPDTLEVRGNLAHWTGEAGDAAGARKQFAALLPVYESVLGPEHPDILIVRAGLARWTGEAGDAAGARDQHAALLPIHERVLGPEHPTTLTTRRNLAYWAEQCGR
jgi:Tetratricopeptide repeat